MADRKVFAGHAVRRLRLQHALSQTSMAEMLAISPSYVNLIERNQRPLTAALLLRLAERFDFDPRALAGAEPGGGADAIRRRLADPLFADLEIDRNEVAEWLSAAPGGAEAFARAFDRIGSAGAASDGATDPIADVRRAIERWRNHFADLDAAAEALADELRMGAADLYGALAERLRVRHSLAVRVLPVEVLPNVLHRLDLHARQLQLSETLDPAGRTFAAAYQLGLIEARAELEALVKGAGFAARAAERLFRRHLASYFAAAVMMPYARFVRACEATEYDVELLARRFGASIEQVAHRLTTLQRVGQRGLPFFLLRIDRAGQASKRFAGASGAMLVEAEGRCPLWRVHRAFGRLGVLHIDLVEVAEPGAAPDTPGERWFTMAFSTGPQRVRVGAVAAEFVVLGVAAANASSWRRREGSTWRARRRRSGSAAAPAPAPTARNAPHPPAGRALAVNERERRVSALTFVGD